jgi:hypothetical protein
MLIIHVGMELNLHKTHCHFLVAQLQVELNFHKCKIPVKKKKFFHSILFEQENSSCSRKKNFFISILFQQEKFFLSVLFLTLFRFSDMNPVKNNETQQRNGTQDRSMDRFEGMTSTRCL